MCLLKPVVITYCMRFKWMSCRRDMNGYKICMSKIWYSANYRTAVFDWISFHCPYRGAKTDKTCSIFHHLIENSHMWIHLDFTGNRWSKDNICVAAGGVEGKALFKWRFYFFAFSWNAVCCHCYQESLVCNFSSDVSDLQTVLFHVRLLTWSRA